MFFFNSDQIIFSWQHQIYLTSNNIFDIFLQFLIAKTRWEENSYKKKKITCNFSPEFHFRYKKGKLANKTMFIGVKDHSDNTPNLIL